ncbi:MAG: hypothetical protein JWQ52_903 [Phenylobacterium sp.]|jgi:hypothetical protein|nr:hypothetical protein [Phenylobacterium sp.]
MGSATAAREAAAAQAEPSAEAANTTRVLAPGAAGSLAAFDAQLLADGRITLISLDVLVEQMGPRWPLRRQQVEKFVERLLARELTGEASFLKVSDADYLVCQPDVERLSAQVTCLGFVREVLEHFLGTAARAVEGVFEATTISAGGVEARPISVTDLLAAEAADKVERRRAADLERATAPFAVSDGTSVLVSCTLEPVMELRASSVIGYRLSRRVTLAKSGEPLHPSQIAGLAGVDILRIDLATVVQGLSKVRAFATPPPSLIVPVSYACLSSQRGRAEIIDVLQEAQDCVRHGVIIEIFDVEGAPQASLQEVVASIRPIALFVAARLAPSPLIGVRHLRGVGLRALAFECPPAQSDAEFIGWAQGRIRMAKHVVSAVLLYGAPFAKHPERLSELGATHASLRD